MSQPLVTVLMAVYNGGAYLRFSLESILNQTFKNFELLIINDASTDDSLKIIRSYGDPRVIVHSNAVNLGQTKSLNVGLRLARGKYVARMDADDLVFPQWLEELSNFLERNPEVAVVSAKAAVIKGRSGIVSVLNTPTEWPQMILKSLTFSPINHVGSVGRRNIFLEMGGYDECYHVPADFHLWSRLIRQGYRLALVPRILVAIRFHGENQSRASHHEEMVRIIYDNVRHLTNCLIEERQATLLYKLIYEVSSLGYQDFQEALTILEDVYHQIKPSLGVACFAEKSLTQQRQIATMKRIFASIETGDLEHVRLLSRDYIQHRGWYNSFFLIWVISFGGAMMLRLLSRIYHYTQRVGMQWTLLGETTPKWIH